MSPQGKHSFSTRSTSHRSTNRFIGSKKVFLLILTFTRALTQMSLKQIFDNHWNNGSSCSFNWSIGGSHNFLTLQQSCDPPCHPRAPQFDKAVMLCMSGRERASERASEAAVGKRYAHFPAFPPSQIFCRGQIALCVYVCIVSYYYVASNKL